MTASSGFSFDNCGCPCIQQALNDVAGSNAPALRRDKVGLISFLMSPQNTAGTERVQLDPGNGKRKCVSLNWYQKMCESTVKDSIDCNDTSGTEHEPYCEDVNITNELSTEKLIFNEDNMRRLCAPLGETDQMWIASVINGQMNAILTYLDKKVLAAILANVGNFMDGDAIKAIQLFNTIDDDAVGPRTRAVANIIDEFNQAGLSGTPNLIGANEVNKFVRMIKYGTGNSAGQDVGALGGEFDFFYDRFLEGVFGAGEFLAIAPGVSQLLTWNKYVGDYAKVSESFEHGTIVDPFTGIPFDMKMHYDDRCDQYDIGLELNWELFVVPDEGDASCSDHYGVNGIFNYEACDDITECTDYSVS